MFWNVLECCSIFQICWWITLWWVTPTFLMIDCFLMHKNGWNHHGTWWVSAPGFDKCWYIKPFNGRRPRRWNCMDCDAAGTAATMDLGPLGLTRDFPFHLKGFLSGLNETGSGNILNQLCFLSSALLQFWTLVAKSLIGFTMSGRASLPSHRAFIKILQASAMILLPGLTASTGRIFCQSLSNVLGRGR